MVNRPCVAGAVLHIALLLIHSFSNQSFSYQYSRYHKSQTDGARELKFLRNIHPHHVSHGICQVSCVTCPVSRVRSQVSGVWCHVSGEFVLEKVVELVDGVSIFNGAYLV